MNNWNDKHLQKLKKNGKIRDYHISQKGSRTPQLPKELTKKKSAGLDYLDLNLQYWCNDHALSLEKEFKFDTTRKWRFDYAIPAMKVAVEFEGGIFMEKSGHNTARHYTKDTEKYNRAAAIGWRVIRLTAMNYKTVLPLLDQYYNQ